MSVDKFYFKPWLRTTLKKALPAAAVSMLIKAQNKYYASRRFDHKRAQKYELEHAVRHLKEREEMFIPTYAEFEKFRNKGEYGPDCAIKNLFFGGDQKAWEAFAVGLKGKTSMEIGSGTMGVLTRWWVKDRIIIEPLLDQFKKASMEIFGKTFFTDDMKLYSQPAEPFLKEFEGKVDGTVLCTNAIDHAEKLGFRIEYEIPPGVIPLKNDEVGYGCRAVKI
jgi:hypothetical protein